MSFKHTECITLKGPTSHWHHVPNPTAAGLRRQDQARLSTLSLMAVLDSHDITTQFRLAGKLEHHMMIASSSLCTFLISAHVVEVAILCKSVRRLHHSYKTGAWNYNKIWNWKVELIAFNRRICSSFFFYKGGYNSPMDAASGEKEMMNDSLQVPVSWLSPARNLIKKEWRPILLTRRPLPYLAIGHFASCIFYWTAALRCCETYPSIPWSQK